jgi:hypothetical protein
MIDQLQKSAIEQNTQHDELFYSAISDAQDGEMTVP